MTYFLFVFLIMPVNLAHSLWNTPLPLTKNSVKISSNVKCTYSRQIPSRQFHPRWESPLLVKLWTIYPEKFSLEFFHLNKTVISNRFLDQSRNALFRRNYFQENKTRGKKHLDNSPVTSPHKKLGEDNAR